MMLTDLRIKLQPNHIGKLSLFQYNRAFRTVLPGYYKVALSVLLESILHVLSKNYVKVGMSTRYFIPDHFGLIKTDKKKSIYLNF